MDQLDTTFIQLRWILWSSTLLTNVLSGAASKFDSDEALARALQQEEAGGRTTRASRAARRGGLDDGIATRSRYVSRFPRPRDSHLAASSCRHSFVWSSHTASEREGSLRIPRSLTRCKIVVVFSSISL